MNERLWKNEQYWISNYNYVEAVRKQLTLPDRIQFHDVTLRDGEQSPGVAFRKEEKVHIARLLDEVGVDRIEVALPAVSQEDVEAVKGVVAMRPKAQVFVLCRGMQSDVDLALECGVDGVILELPLGTPRLKYQFPDWNEETVIERAITWSKVAKKAGLEVVLFPMDCTRSEPAFFERFLDRVSKEGAIDAVTLVDTTGSVTPQAATYLVGMMKGLTGKRVEVHTHTDFGMGVATSMAAVCAGAEVVHVSVGGLGERTGNTPLEEAAVAAKTLYGMETTIQFAKLPDLVKEVAEIARFQLAPNKPLVGSRAFTRESGMGVDMVRTQPLGLFGVNPSWIGRQPDYVLGKKSGLMSVTMKLEDLGMPPVSAEAQKAILEGIKTLGLQKKGLVTDEEFKAIAKSVTA